MKRRLYFLALLLMLFLLSGPTLVAGSDPTYTPFDYLTPTEQAYVTSMRSWITDIKSRIDTARADLKTVFLQESNQWYPTFLGELNSVNDGIAEMQKTTAPESFGEVEARCKSIGDIPTGPVFFFDSPQRLQSDPITAAQLVAKLDSELSGVASRLDGLSSDINKRIDAIAREEKVAEQMISNWIQSCEKSATTK